MPKPATSDIAYDKIMTHLLTPGESELTPSYAKIFDRWKKADDLLDRYPNQKDAISVYRQKFPDLSNSQVYYDFANAKKVFNNFNTHDKERLRTWLINDIVKIINAAKLAGAKGFKAWNAAHSNLIKAAQLDVKEDISIDSEILESHNFYTIINVNGKQIKADFSTFEKLPDATKKKLSDVINSKPMTEDAAFEIINPDGK